MNINKTADESIVEHATALLQCFVDSNLSLKEKQELTKWIIWFFDYQDAININNQKEIDFLQQKLNFSFLPLSYKNSLQEFKNANLFYNKTSSFEELKKLFLNYSTTQVIKTVTAFSKTFLKCMKNYNIQLENNFTENFYALIYTIHYHLSYIFKTKLQKIVNSFIKIIKTKVFCKTLKKEIFLINLIFNTNETYFNKIQLIQLSNFIYKLHDIFQESTDINDVDEKIINLIFNQPKKINISMNALLKNYQINFYHEIWKNNNINEKKSKLLMHLFAYETYFIQGHDNHKIYENLVLKNIINEDKYWIILHKYKIINKA